MIRQTSLDSYKTIQENGLLPRLKWETYTALFEHGPCTARELFYKAGWHHDKNNHNISSRLGELRDLGTVYEVEERPCQYTGIDVIVWDVTANLHRKIIKPKKVKCSHCRGTGYQQSTDEVRKDETMTNQVTVTVSGANRVEIVKNLRAFADNLDGAPAAAKTGKVVATETADEVEAADDADDEEFAPKKKTAAKKGASFDDEAEAEVEADDEAEVEDEEVEEAPAPKKSAKAKAPTKEDVNEACKAHAKRHSFATTQALLLKKFKTKSVSTLKPEHYPAVIAAMKG